MSATSRHNARAKAFSLLLSVPSTSYLTASLAHSAAGRFPQPKAANSMSTHADMTPTPASAHLKPLISSAIQTESQPVYVGSLAPEHPAVGVALFQGRKKYMEDFILVLTEQQLHRRCHSERDDLKSSQPLGFDLYAVVDGHLGSAAATFVVENLPRVLYRHFAAIPKSKEDSVPTDADQAAGASAERELAEKFALRQTFLELHERFLQSLDEVARDSNLQPETNDGTFTNGTAAVGEYFSGCTLTVVLHFRREQRVVSANVGDSRALAWLPGVSTKVNDCRMSPAPTADVVPLTMDHWPNDPTERSRIESSGGCELFRSLASGWAACSVPQPGRSPFAQVRDGGALRLPRKAGRVVLRRSSCRRQ